ncbi:MAG TPA: hypothetical protein VHC95_07120 [Opitutales bacterium]|nr:hypothetical protein [Opitutales bacterium]
MRPHATYPNEEGPTIDGDAGWSGVDLRRDPGILPQGLASAAQNLEFRQGGAETRPSFETKAWGQDYALANLEDPALDCDDIDFDLPWGFGEVLGAEDFSNPNGQDMVLLAVKNGVWKIVPHAPPDLIKIEDGTGILTGPVEFVQCFDRVVMLRGEGLPDLVWNPALDFTAGLDAFRPVSQTDARNPDPANTFGDGTQPIPPSTCGALLGSRLWLDFAGDQLGVSDILDYTRFSAAESQLRANAGKADSIVALRPLAEQQMVVFCDDSIFLFQNAVGDLSTLVQAVLTRQHGLAARHAVAQWGNDLWFLAGRSRGVYSLGATAQGLIQAGADPVSAPIDPLLQRVNWGAIGGACAESHDGRFYLAVPLDGATHNNALLVYDGLNQAWAGLWNADFLDVYRFVKVKVGGSWRLAWVTGNSNANRQWHGALVHLGDDLQDWAFGAAQPIVSTLTTRGYGGVLSGSPEWKRFLAADVEVETFYPRLTLTLTASGQRAQTLLDGATPNRTASVKFAGKPVSLDNHDGRLGCADRADYAVLTGDFPLTFGGGVALGRFRRQTLRRRVRARGRYAQVALTCDRGAMRVRGANLQFIITDREDVSR